MIMALIGLLLVASVMTGCVTIRKKDGGNTDDPVSRETNTTVRQDDESASEPGQPGGNGDAADGSTGGEAGKIPALSDDEIAEAYRKAVEAFGWFEFGTMPADYSDIKEADGYQYNRVAHETIKTYDDLKSYLQTLFTDDIVERLLTGGGSDIRLYRDIDGALYTIPVGRGSDIFKGEETYGIIREGDGKVIYRVTVEVYDDPDMQTVAGTEQYNFPLEYIDGRWLFTHFELVR